MRHRPRHLRSSVRRGSLACLFSTATLALPPNALAQQPTTPTAAPTAPLATPPLTTPPLTTPPLATPPLATSRFAVLAAADDPFGRRVIAELEALGFQALRVDPPADPPSRETLESAARTAGALAAICAVPSRRGVEIWIADRVTGKTVLRELTSDSTAPDPESALALRTVELLRASLLELTLPGPPPGEVPATLDLRDKLSLPQPPSQTGALPSPLTAALPPGPSLGVGPGAGALAPTPPLAPTLRLSVSGGALVSPGGFDPAAILELTLAWMPSDHLGALALATLPLSRPRIQGVHGSADLATTLVGGGIRFLFTTRAHRWAPSVDVGVTAVSLQVSGAPNVGYTSADVGAWTAAPLVRAGLAYAPHPMLRGRLDLTGTAVLQGVTVALANQEVATFGIPILVASAGVDFGWF